MIGDLFEANSPLRKAARLVHSGASLIRQIRKFSRFGVLDDRPAGLLEMRLLRSLKQAMALPVKSLRLGTPAAAQQNGGMNDVPPTPKPRRRWKRWAALSLALVIGCGVWMSGESETVRRARGLRVGMTEAEVTAVMGEPTFSNAIPPSSGFVASIDHSFFFLTPFENWTVERRSDVSRFIVVPLGFKPWEPVWPVEVYFRFGKVEKVFRYGAAIVGHESSDPMPKLFHQPALPGLN